MQEQLPRRLGRGENKGYPIHYILINKRILKKRIVLFLLTPPSPSGEGFKSEFILLNSIFQHLTVT